MNLDPNPYILNPKIDTDLHRYVASLQSFSPPSAVKRQYLVVSNQ